MSKLSSTAWTLHNLGLATSIGGSLFGQGAFQPALAHNIDDQAERAKISDEAWSRYSIWNLAAHGVVAATWIAGRTFLSGREVSGTARTLTRVKDALVIASVVTGVTTVILGKLLGHQASKPAQALDEEDERDEAQIQTLRNAVKLAGAANIVSNAAMAAVSTQLAMEGNQSLPFSIVSRFLA